MSTATPREIVRTEHWMRPSELPSFFFDCQQTRAVVRIKAAWGDVFHSRVFAVNSECVALAHVRYHPPLAQWSETTGHIAPLAGIEEVAVLDEERRVVRTIAVGETMPDWERTRLENEGALADGRFYDPPLGDR